MSARWSSRLDDGVDEEQGVKERDGQAADSGDWEVVDAQCWWRTLFSSVSWSFSPQETPLGKPRVARPPYYHSPPSKSIPPASYELEDVSLNPDLVGCRMAEYAVTSYERDVGFGYTAYPTVDRKDCGLPLSLNLSLTDEDVVAKKDRWREAVADLLTSDTEDTLSSSLTGSTRSDNSADFFAMPATPVSKATYANILLKNVSPSSSVSDDSPVTTPSKALNAFASSFVPSSEASALSSFTFPTLNPPNTSTTRLTTVKIKKDDQGFFTDVQVGSDTPPSQTVHAPLPLFCQDASPRRRTRTSKTREIIDRLRSKQADNLAECISHSPSPIFHDLSFIQPRLSVSEDGGDRDRESNLSTPSLDEEEDGWINVGVEAPTLTKTKRRRDLFSALTRRRTDSTSSLHAQDDAAEEKNPRCASPASDGWIEGLPAVETKPVDPPAPPPAPAPAPAPKRSAYSSKAPPPPKPQPQPQQQHQQRKKNQHANKSSSSSSSYRSSSVSPTYPTFAMATTRPIPTHIPPMLAPSHMAMMAPGPPPPVPLPVPFFFGPPAGAHYQPMPVPAYAAGPAQAYMQPPAQFVPVGMVPGMQRHPMTVGARYGVAPHR